MALKDELPEDILYGGPSSLCLDICDDSLFDLASRNAFAFYLHSFPCSNLDLPSVHGHGHAFPEIYYVVDLVALDSLTYAFAEHSFDPVQPPIAMYHGRKLKEPS